MGPAATEVCAREVLAAWDLGRGATVRRLAGGLINDTFEVAEGPQAWVLQRVHPSFPAEIHRNIAAVTERLVERQLATPTLIATRAGRWCHETGGEVWRLMTRMPGVSFHRVERPAQAYSAAGLLGRFHRCLVGLQHEFVGLRAGVHDTDQHLQTLAEAVAAGAGHPLYEQVVPLAERIAVAAGGLPRLDNLPTPVVHGDPKFSNVLFAAAQPPGADQALCLVDLDTVGPAGLHLELGDMWRSWCNPKGEDESVARLDMEWFSASLAGYSAHGLVPDPAEREALVYGFEWITLELTARFAADALRECYFGWDATRFASRGHHNLVRALGQWSLHEQVVATRRRRGELISAAW